MRELQAEFNQKLIEHLEALGNRLSSIEKLLSAESKPPTAEHSCIRCNDTGEINVLIPHTMADSQDIPWPDCSYSKEPEFVTCELELPIAKQEPEWRPMSEAPKDRDIEVKLNGEVRIAWYYAKEEWVISGCIFHEEYLSGWRPL